MPEDGLYYISAYFAGVDGSRLSNYKFQLIILEGSTELGVYGENALSSSTSFAGSLSIHLVNSLVPLEKGTKITCSVWTSDAGQKVNIKMWHVKLRSFKNPNNTIIPI